LYENVTPHGVIVVDDYGHFEGCRRAIDEFIAGLGIPVLLNHIDYTGRFWIKG
jgi:O-methyltransferase